MFGTRIPRTALTLVGMAAAALAIGACGGGDDEGDGAQSKQAPTLAASKDAKGTVTFCTGKDTSGDQAAVVKAFNQRYKGQGLRARLLEFPESADEIRNQFIQRQQAKSTECDVYRADTVYMAEFVAQGWLLEMTEYARSRAREYIPSTMSTVAVGGRSYGMPYDTDAALIFYRTDRVGEPPATWQQLYTAAADSGGIVYQGAAYEGLTCDFLEIAHAAGGEVLDKEGEKSVIDSPQNRAALQLMVDGIKNGAAPRGVTTYQEEHSRRAFESGKPTFMRQWPYAYSISNKARKVKGKFAVTPLPRFEGAGKAGILGGKNLTIAAYSKNPEGAMLFIDLATSAETATRNAVEFGRAPAIAAIYDDAKVQRAMPFAAELKQAVAQARTRPITPVYPQVSQAIYKNVNAALSGEVSPAKALQTADRQINDALATF